MMHTAHSLHDCAEAEKKTTKKESLVWCSRRGCCAVVVIFSSFSFSLSLSAIFTTPTKTCARSRSVTKYVYLYIYIFALPKKEINNERKKGKNIFSNSMHSTQYSTVMIVSNIIIDSTCLALKNTCRLAIRWFHMHICNIYTHISGVQS